jgi:hypothetical protein
MIRFAVLLAVRNNYISHPLRHLANAAAAGQKPGPIVGPGAYAPAAYVGYQMPALL